MRALSLPEGWSTWTRNYELDIHDELRAAGYRWVIGIDEAGRGPLAGPVTAAAALFDLEAEAEWLEVSDSKRLSERARLELEPRILAELVNAVVHVGPDEIARLNILGATMRAMEQALAQLLERQPDAAGAPVLIDGGRVPHPLKGSALAVVKGDLRCRSIGAASILAKTARDRVMIEAALRFPGYGFERHKGYPTAAHMSALAELGPTEIHRRGFAPVDAAFAALAGESDH